MAQAYVEALIYGFDQWRWNFDDPYGTPAAVSFSFLTAIPPHYNGEGEDFISNFQAFNAAQKTAAREVLADWAEVANITLSDLGNGAGGQILFGMNQQSGSAGYASVPSLFFAAAGDVWIANTPAGTYATNLNVTPGSYGYLTLLHETGHALGLKHPFDVIEGGGSEVTLPGATDSDRYTVMSYSHQANELFMRVLNPGTVSEDLYYFSVHPAGPMLYDIAAIQHLYGANMATRSDNTLYDDFDPDEPFFMCIWDGGGKDTISVANFTLGCEIDLNAGEFSNVAVLPDAIPPGWTAPTPTYNGQNNLSIAFGVVIENATGGAGNDTLTGNSAGNVLRGNAGADRLAGGGGADQLVGGQGVDLLIGGNGADQFTFNAAPVASTADSVQDFSRVQGDRLVLDDAVFQVGAAVTSGELRSATNISAAGGATTLAQRLLYDSDSGKLYYDADGSGAAFAPALVATLVNKPVLAPAAFTVI